MGVFEASEAPTCPSYVTLGCPQGPGASVVLTPTGWAVCSRAATQGGTGWGLQGAGQLPRGYRSSKKEPRPWPRYPALDPTSSCSVAASHVARAQGHGSHSICLWVYVHSQVMPRALSGLGPPTLEVLASTESPFLARAGAMPSAGQIGRAHV